MDPAGSSPAGGSEFRFGESGGEERSILIPERYLPEIAAPGGEAHLGADSAVTPEERVAIERGNLVALWMQDLDRRSAPSSLDGLVVAAMNPGHRQTRAATTVSSLRRLTAPQQLDIQVAGMILGEDPSSLDPAPSELDHLVEERVEQPAAGLVKGMAQRLDAVQAPEELEALLELQLDSGLHRRPVRRRSRLQSAGVGVALAACLLLLTRLGGESTVSDNATIEEFAAATTTAAAGERPDGRFTSASGIVFQVSVVDSDSASAADRAVLGLVGLPTTGGS